MFRRHVLIIAWLCVCVAHCSWSDHSPIDAGTDAGTDPGVETETDAEQTDGTDAGNDSSTDAGNDSGTDAGDDDPGPTPLPLGPEAVESLGAGGGIDVGSAGWIAPDGTILVVWEHFDEAFTRGELLVSRSADASHWSAPEPLALGDAVFQASPSLVGRDDQVDLYLLRSAGLYHPAEIAASHRSGDAFGQPRILPAIPGLDGLLSWPRFYSLDEAGTAVVFRSGTSRPHVAFSTDGIDFESPVQIYAQAAAMPALGRFRTGDFTATFQTGSGGSMTSWLSLSANGATWSDPLRVSDASTNVHDTTLVPRLDGHLDLYYIYPAGPVGFCLFRRALDPEGRLGAEQQVTLPEVGEVSKPEGVRLPDGRILLMWAEITRRGGGGYPVEQILRSASIRGDAP